MDQQILKQFANYGSVNKEDVDLLLQLAKEQQRGDSSSTSTAKASWRGDYEGSLNQIKKDQTILSQTEKIAEMHGQIPFMLPPHLLSNFNFPNGFPASTNPNGHSTEASKSYDLRCLFCGTSFSSQDDLNQHIVKQHIPTNSEQEKKRSSVDEDKQHGDVKNMFHSKSWSDSSSHSSDVDSAHSNFPIPVPNFSLFNEIASATNSSEKETRNSGGGGLPAFNMNLPLNPSLFSLPGAFGLLNPLLNYQNLINAKGVPGALPGVNISPYGYLPYVGIPSNPAVNLPSIPGRFPYFTGLSLGLPNSSNQVSPTSSNEQSLKNSSSSNRNELEQPSSVSEVLNGPSPALPHSDSHQRRLSVPMMPYSNEFRVPHPYTRIRKPSHNTHSHEEKAESTNEPAYDQQIRNAQATAKKRSSVNDKSSNHLNAKSIEQHISKLISNNEKLLTNPELERVKPRRVFRRNSLDPASLSSYSSGMSKYNSRDAACYREAAKKPRRMLSECENSYRQPNSDPKSLDAHESHTSPLSFAEYNKMIQLTRAPFALTDEHRHPGSSVTNKANEQFSHETSHEMSKIHGQESLPVKRNYPSSYSHSNKKSRRSSFFECNDCGVRYRKEENYKIHKKIYCKFKNANTLFNANEKLRRHSDLPKVPTCTSGQTLSLDRSTHRLLPHFELARPVTSSTLAMPPALDRPTCPLKTTRPDLCRTKSAEASLETALVHESRWKRSNHSFSSPLFSGLQVQTSASTPAVSHLTVPHSDQNTACSVSGITSTMPASKLPPNKRHLMRHNFERESDSTPSPQSDLTSSTDKPTDVPSSNIEDKASEANEIHCESKYDDSLIPRSNYKLLVHQISLRNLQDIGMMGDLSANLFTKSVWSWEQMQNLKHDKMPDLSCDTSSHNILQGMPTSMRKFSVPSRFLPSASSAASSSLNNNFSQFDKTNSLNLSSRSQCDSTESTHDKDSLDVNTLSSSAKPSVENDHHKRFFKEDFARDFNLDEPGADAESVSSDQKPHSDISETVSPCSEENAKLLKTGETIRREKSVVLYPHVDPVLESHTFASFCCMVSPQPACIEITKSTDSVNPHLSMYSEWAASEPFLIPEDLTVGDILNGWCRCRALSERGVVTCLCKKTELLLTDNKDYEKSNKTSAKNSTENVENINQIDCDKSLCHCVSEPYKEANVTKFKSRFVFTSCHHKHSANGFPYAMLPDFNKLPSSAPLLAGDDVQRSNEPDDVTDDITPMESSPSVEDDGTSSAPRESDAADVSKELNGKVKSGRVKRLRSRKDRSSTSPREKRKAAEGASISPTTVMAIHQDGVCCDVTDDKSGCALCSMKAGKTGLLPERRDSTGSKSPPPPTLKFTKVTSSNPPAVTEAVLDRTRGTSGNTQHWVSDTSQMSIEPSKPISSSPISGGSGTEDTPHQRPLFMGDSAVNVSDMSKNGMPDRNGSAVSPSLAEVVSEVMRSAAMQSKMHSKRRQLLSGSRALHLRENDEESPALKRRNVRCSSQSTRVEENCDTSTSSAPGELLSSSEEKRVDATQNTTITTPDPCVDKNGGKLFTNFDDTSLSLSEANIHHEADSSANDDDDTGVRYDAAKVDGPPRSPGSNIAARSFPCSECQIAFRIGGHLAKHLRSKGHFVAVQKKTLNRLKLNQIQKLYGIPGLLDVDQPLAEQPVVDHHQPSHKGNGSISDPELITGSDVLARAQVRALLEGNDEYACVPPPLPEHPRPCEEPQDGNSNQNDPRPYKCIACKVAFRFQGHLDRHFRSNSHLIAIGHYEQTPDVLTDGSSLEEQPCTSSLAEHICITSSTNPPHITSPAKYSVNTSLAEQPRTSLVVEQSCIAKPPDNQATIAAGQHNGKAKEDTETIPTTSSGQVFEMRNPTDGEKRDCEVRRIIPNGFLSNRTISSSSSSTDHLSVEADHPSNFSSTSQLNGDSECKQSVLGHEHIAPKHPLPCRASCT